MTCDIQVTYFDGRVTPLAGPTLLHIIKLAHQVGSSRSRRGETIEATLALLSALGSLRQMLRAKDDSAGKVTLSPGITFLHTIED